MLTSPSWTSWSVSGAAVRTSLEPPVASTAELHWTPRNLVSDSGWREAPRLRDMTEFRFANSTAQIEGDLVPVSELSLAAGDGVFFEQHVMLWKDDQTSLVAMPAGGGLKRSFGGMPHILSRVDGPGRVAFSRDAPGELVVLPLHPGVEVDVREHAFLLASHSVEYSFVRIKDLTSLLHGGGGMFMDRFVTQGAPGLLILHGNGNVFERVLRQGENDPRRTRRVPLQGLVGTDGRKAAERENGPAAARVVSRGNDRTRTCRHPVDVRAPPHGLNTEQELGRD